MYEQGRVRENCAIVDSLHMSQMSGARKLKTCGHIEGQGP